MIRDRDDTLPPSVIVVRRRRHPVPSFDGACATADGSIIGHLPLQTPCAFAFAIPFKLAFAAERRLSILFITASAPHARWRSQPTAMAIGRGTKH